MFHLEAARKDESIPNFRHQPLDLRKNQIRLFELHLGHESDSRVKGSLKVIDNTKYLSYTALSYVWGPPEPFENILVDGKLLKIRQNLHDFLHTLLTSTKLVANNRNNPRHYWVDQICIDQENVDERNHQVQLMHQVFRNARVVFAYLGTNPDGILVADLFKGPPAKELSLRRFTSDESQVLRRLFQSPYWFRHWVLQELLLAKQCTILYGSHNIDLRELVHLWPSWASRNPDAEQHVLTTFSMSTNCSWNEPLPLIFLGRTMALPTACENPRDKIYGLQSVLLETMQIEVNYGLSVEEVFFDAAIRFYQHELKFPYFKAPILAMALAMKLIEQPKKAHMKQLLDEAHPWLLREVKSKIDEHRPNEKIMIHEG